MSRAPPAWPRVHGWPLSPPATAMLIGGCLATGALGGLALHLAHAGRAGGVAAESASSGSLPTHALAGDAVWPPGRRLAPQFALRDQSNRLVSLSGERGRTVLLTFMDSHCKFICTLQGPSIRTVLERVGSHRAVTLLVVSVNPWEDTAASSGAAGARYGFSGDWHWLRGSPAGLRPVWRAYGIEVAQAQGDVNHSTAIYLIDGRGYERAGFNYPFPSGQVVRDLRALSS